MKPKTTISSKRQKSIDADTGIEGHLRETLPLPLCSTPSSSKRRKGNDASQGIIMFYYLICFLRCMLILIIIFINAITEKDVVFLNKITDITGVQGEELENEGTNLIYFCTISCYSTLFSCYFIVQNF